MLSSGITSTISLRTRGSLYPTDSYSHCSNVRRPFAYSSSKPCCSCCCTSICSMPLSPSYGCSLYGLRQSSLIQWSPYRRLISGGFDYYSRVLASDVDGICYCDRVCKGESVWRRKGGLSKCWVYEERSERYEDGSVDEAEVLLSLFTEDVGEECLLASKERRRVVRKQAVEKKDNGDVCDECGSRKKRVGVGVSESYSGSGSIVSSRKNGNRRRNDQMGEEGLVREKNRRAILREECKLKNRTEQEKDEREALLRKLRHRADEKRERSMLRKENWKVRLRTEEEEDLLGGEEHRQKMRKDASSCSSYYSLSSNGDYVSDDEIEIMERRSVGDLLSGHKKDSSNNEVVYQGEEDGKREDYREDHRLGLTRLSSSKEFHTGSSVTESDFRKKSEKRLADISVEEVDSRKETSLKESKSSILHESNYEKASEYSQSNDDRKVKSCGSMPFDEARKQQLRQMGDEVSRQSETMLKYRQSVERQHDLSGCVRNSSGSRRVYSAKDEVAKVASSNQETVGEHKAVVGLSTREDDYQRNSCKIGEVSEIQETDIRKTSVSQQKFETSVRTDDYSINVLSSINDAKKQQQQYDQESSLVESRGKSQQLTKRDGKSILEGETNEITKQENINLVSTPSLESKEPRSLMHGKITSRFDSRNESDELNKVLIIHSGNTSARRVGDRNKTKSETPVTPPPNLPETSALSQGSKVVIATDKDAIGSAAGLEKSSSRYVGEFVEQARHGILSSEIQTEEDTLETKSSHEESSGDSLPKEHDLKSDNQQSRTKGPSDEMWKVDEPSVQKPSKEEIQDTASKAGNAVVKRTGRSLWNIIADIVLLRWSPHSENHSSDRKTGGRSSPNQSTSSETWFSGHELEENEEATEENDRRIIRQGLSPSHREVNIRSQFEESPSSSTLEGRLSYVEINAPSSSIIRVSGSPEASISLPSNGETSEGNSLQTSSAAVVDSSIRLPSLGLQRSPAVRGDIEAGSAPTSDSAMSDQQNTGSMEQSVSMVSEAEVKQRKLKRKDQVVRDRFDEWAEAYELEAEQRKFDEMFMREALLEAQKAADNWEVPVGAVLVHNGKIIARGCNLVEELRDSTAHAEILCIREASSMLRAWRLAETTLYVTLEPCPMCAGAILQARIDTVVWGAPNKLLGADGSWIRLFPGDGGNGAEQSDKPPAPIHPFHPKMTIRRGVLASECADAMQQFFRRKRKKEKKDDTPSPLPPCLPVSHRPSRFLAKMHDAFNLMFCL